MSTEVAQCISCGYMIGWFQHTQLRYSVSCPDCEKPEFAGPGVFVPEFEGTPLNEALKRRILILGNPNMLPLGWKRKGYVFKDGSWREP